MKLNDQLKPCPFCGSKPEIQTDYRYPKYGKLAGKCVTAYEVVCRNIDCIIYNADNRYRLTEKEAIEYWNRRANE